MRKLPEGRLLTETNTVPAIRSGPAYRFIFEDAHRLLNGFNQNTLSSWLMAVTLDAAGSKILRLRLHYERDTWPRKFGVIQNLCQKGLLDFDAVERGTSLIFASTFTASTFGNVIQNQVSNHMVCCSCALIFRPQPSLPPPPSPLGRACEAWL